MSQLQPIQVMTQQIAEAISSVLEMDVTIVDETMVRIAGTGYYKESIGQKILWENAVYRQVLERAKEYTVADVRTSNDCEACERYATCRELAHLCCPIILGTEAIGVIGLIAFSQRQQKELVEKGEQLLVFIRKMAELIAAKVVEKNTLNRLVFLKNQMETVLNFVAEGIIAVDQQARIINMNLAAEKLLKVKGGQVFGFHINEVFPGTPVAEVLREGVGFLDREIKVWHQGRQHHYLINARPMLVEGIVQGVVASFRVPYGGQLAVNKELKITFDEIIGASAAIALVKEEGKMAARGTATILITGESGTGKEMFARAIHAESDRCLGPFVAVNCAAIPENLLESELFGYEEGSFTGAKKGGKPGKFQIANGGTLFLDEIGDMPLALQAKLLRVIQDKMVERVGGVSLCPVNIRIIAATHRDVEGMVKTGTFREDLFYRLHVFGLTLPPLRQRKGDIALLAGYFLAKHGGAYHKGPIHITAEAQMLLEEYHWPGNVRELENIIESTVVKLYGDTITPRELPSKLYNREQAPAAAVTDPEWEKIQQALAAFGLTVAGKRRAASSLGMSVATLYRKINKYKGNC